MDNRKIINKFIDKPFEYPDELSDVEQRLKKRIMKEHRKKTAVYSSISSAAAILIFVVLVNTSTAFASAVSNVPIIGKLIEYIKFDKGLCSAVKNDYMDEVMLTSFDGHQKLLLPYVIADEHNLVLFFKLPHEFNQLENQWAGINLKDMRDRSTGKKVDGFSYSTSNLSLDLRKQNDGLIMHRYHFSEGTLPKSIDIDVELELKTVEDQVYYESQEEAENSHENTKEKIGTFNFKIDFNNFAKPITYEINESHTIMGQKFTIEKMKVYPTGTEVMFKFSDENDSFIKGLELEVEQDKVKVLKGSDGLSASYDEKNSCMSVYIESNYFEKQDEQKLVISGVRLIKKDEEYITVDLDSKTITPNITNLELKEVIRKGNKADLVFKTETSNGEICGLFSHSYKDADGNKYDFKEQENTCSNSVMETSIKVQYPPSGKIILKRELTPKITLKEPIKINIPESK